LTFAVRSGTGVQTVTGVSDADGTFVGKVFLFQSGYAALNTLTSGSAPTNRYMDVRGVDNGSVRSAFSVVDVYSIFNFKDVYGSQSLGDYSLIDTAGTVQRTAKITDIRAGEFDLTYVTNTRTGDDVLVTVFGGDDLDVAFTGSTNGAKTTPSKPQGFVSIYVPPPSASGGTATSAGGQNVAWGFATRDGVYGASALGVAAQGNNFSAQLTTAWSAVVDQALGTIISAPTVSAWGDTSFTIADNSGGVATAVPLAFCGDLIRCVGGAETQPVSTGLQTIDVGISAKAVLFLGTGYPVSAAVQSPVGQSVHGWAAGSTQHGFWSGESENGNTGPSTGARYLSNSSVLRFATPAGSSTTFGSIASVSSINTDGTVVVDWTAVDGTARQFLWFAIGEDIPPPPPNPTPIYRTREVVRRRLRRAPIVWSEKGGLQTRVRINLFAVDMQPGVGTADTPDPLVMIRASKDGGFTWSNERRVSAGRVGEYFDRINTWRWGQGREWVFEVACTDPVTWNLIGAYFDAEPGES
jgi:hypothetical protein